MVQLTTPTPSRSCFSCVTAPISCIGSRGVCLISTAGSAVAALARKIAAFIVYAATLIFSPVTCLFNRCWNRAQPVQTTGTSAHTPIPQTTQTTPTPFVPYVPNPENVQIGATFLFEVLDENPELLTDHPACMETPENAQKFFARTTVYLLSLNGDDRLDAPETLPFFARRPFGYIGQGANPNQPTFTRSFNNLRNAFNDLTREDQESVQERFLQFIPEEQTPLYSKYAEIISSMKTAFNELSEDDKDIVKEYLKTNKLPREQADRLVIANHMDRLRQAVKDSVRSSFLGLAPEDQGPVRQFLRGTLDENLSRADHVDALFALINTIFLDLVPETAPISGEIDPLDEAENPSTKNLRALLRRALLTNFMEADNFLDRADTLAKNLVAQNPDFVACANAARTRHLESLNNPQPSTSQIIPQSPSIADVLRSPTHSSTAGPLLATTPLAEAIHCPTNSADGKDLLVQLLQLRRNEKPETRAQIKKMLGRGEEAVRKMFASLLFSALTKGCATPLTEIPRLPAFMLQEVETDITFADTTEALRVVYHNFSEEDQQVIAEISKNSQNLDHNSTDRRERFVCKFNELKTQLIENNNAFAAAAAAAREAYLAAEER